jgi:hypothetical protein
MEPATVPKSTYANDVLVIHLFTLRNIRRVKIYLEAFEALGELENSQQAKRAQHRHARRPLGHEKLGKGDHHH